MRGGKVLVLHGGASPEIYDPADGTWKAASSPNRISGSPVVLPDGRALFLGRESVDNRSFPGPVGEIYDPDTDTWTGPGELNLPRTAGHSATVLADGRVLVVGGFDGQSGSGGITFAVSRAEIYDPVSNSWTEASDSGQPRRGHAAVLLDDGRVLVAGGSEGTDTRWPWPPRPPVLEPLLEAQIYDPVTDQWTETASLSTAQPNATRKAFMLGDSTVMVRNEIYDPATETWAPVDGPTHSSAPQVGLDDGRVLNLGSGSSGVETFDPATRTWSVTGEVPPGWGAPDAIGPRIEYSLTTLAASPTAG